MSYIIRAVQSTWTTAYILKKRREVPSRENLANLDVENFPSLYYNMCSMRRIASISMSEDEMYIVVVKERNAASTVRTVTAASGCQQPLIAGPARVRLEAVACQSKTSVSCTPATSKTQLSISIAFILHNQPRSTSLKFKRNHQLFICAFYSVLSIVDRPNHDGDYAVRSFLDKVHIESIISHCE